VLVLHVLYGAGSGGLASVRNTDWYSRCICEVNSTLGKFIGPRDANPWLRHKNLVLEYK